MMKFNRKMHLIAEMMTVFEVSRDKVFQRACSFRHVGLDRVLLNIYDVPFEVERYIYFIVS